MRARPLGKADLGAARRTPGRLAPIRRWPAAREPRRDPRRWSLDRVGRRAASVLAAAAALAVASPARAVQPPTIYDNYHSYPVGSRAAGLAGAYTALACDEGALHYNPAALACASASRLELSANAYMIQSLSVPDAFGSGEDIAALTYHSVPSIVGAVRLLEQGAGDGAGRIALGVSVSVPRSIALKVDPADPERRNHVAFSVRDDLTAADLGVGWQLSRRVALGLSVGAVLRTYEASYSALLVSDVAAACGAGGALACSGFYALHDSQELWAVGGRAKLGLRSVFGPIALGLALTSPTFHLHGRATYSRTATLAIPSSGGAAGEHEYRATPSRLEGSSEVGLPLRMAAGVSYTGARFTAALDLSLNMPHRTRAAYDLSPRRIGGVPPPADLQDRVLEREAQPNMSVGVELALTPGLALDLGFFTDLSSVPERDPDAPLADTRTLAEDRVHMFGGSVALGVIAAQSRGWFGVSVEGGRADAQVVRGDFTLENALANGLEYGATSTLTRWSVVGMIGSNYSFAGGP